MPEPARVPLTIRLSPAATRALAAQEPAATTPLEAVLEQIASGPPPEDTPATTHTAPVDPQLLQRAEAAAAGRGTSLTTAIEHVLLEQPVLLPPARLARLLGTDLSTLTRALTNDPNSPPSRGTGKKLYDAREVITWWPTRPNRGRRWPAHPGSGRPTTE